MNKTRTLFPLIGTLLVAARMCHLGILWEGDAYPLAAAGQILHGKALYRDLWFDKPPLLAVFYLLWGAQPGWPLRVAGAVVALGACVLAYVFARQMWSRREGLWAAGLLAFFLIFDFPSSVIPVASDLLMLPAHLAAVWLAWKRRPFWSGVVAAVAFWISPKGLFVAAVCAVWNPVGVPLLAAGWAATSGVAVAVLAGTGALAPYWEEVWQWGRLYAAAPFLESPLRNGAVRTLNWLGFHAALVGAAACFFTRLARARPARTGELVRWIAWLAIAVAGVAAGLRFFPRYYFLLLPVAVLAAARGFTVLGRRAELVALLLLIPATRFGPTYLHAITDAAWRDTAMDRDSRAAAALTGAYARRGDTLFVWGYRPEIYVYTGLPVATMYLDSQPLSGVPADRHLTQSTAVEPEAAPRARRAVLVRSRPSIVIDGLGPYNPLLGISRYPDLREWLRGYREVAHTAGAVIYRRIE